MHRPPPARRGPGCPTGAVVLAALVALPILAAGVAAQPPPAARVADEIEVVEVLLDVLVTGPQGHVIVGLGKEDFVVEEEGRAVEIRSLSFYSNRRLLAPGAPMADVGLTEDRYFVLLIARPPSGPERDPLLIARLPGAGRACAEWVRRELLPNDHLAVAAFDGGLNLVRDFTRDPEAIADAIGRAATGRAPRRHWPTRIVAAAGPSLAGLMRDPDLRSRTTGITAALGELAGALAAIPGRKILILLGVEFPPAGSSADRRRQQAMIEALNGSNVAVYALDVTGRGRRPGLEHLTRATGGGYPFHGRDLLEPLREIERENSGFYLLSYRSAQPRGEGGYRRVVVRTTNPELRARARSGHGPRLDDGGR